MPTCSKPSTDVITVANGYPILPPIRGSGYITYYCNGGYLDLDGEAFANLTSDDGVWVGLHDYPTYGPNMGQPHWILHNTVTGENRTIWGENKPMVRQPDPNGSDIDWWRRQVYGDTGPSPHAWYVIRNDTSGQSKPSGNTCNGDIDVNVDFTATYTFVSCDYYRGAPPPTPDITLELLATLAAPVPAPDAAPTPAPAVAPAPAPLVLLPVLPPPPPPPSPAPPTPLPVTILGTPPPPVPVSSSIVSFNIHVVLLTIAIAMTVAFGA